MAIETPARAKRTGPGSQNTAGLDLDELRQLWLKPLWLVLGDAFTAEPKTDIVPHIVSALNETIRLMSKIDEIIEADGGWPLQ